MSAQPSWSFSEAVRWLHAKTEALRSSGASVEFEVQATGRASARMRVERAMCVGELTVWDDGAAHLAILNSRSGDIVFEQDGVSLAGTSLEVALKTFFAKLGVGQPE